MHHIGQLSVNKQINMKQLTIEAFKGMLNNALTHIKAREDEVDPVEGGSARSADG